MRIGPPPRAEHSARWVLGPESWGNPEQQREEGSLGEKAAEQGQTPDSGTISAPSACALGHQERESLLLRTCRTEAQKMISSQSLDQASP